MNIYLIGMPGSGKSTIGKELAAYLNRPHVDLDGYIEQKSFMFIPEIFDTYGESFFRDLETNCLIELQEFKNTIISCGGGIVVKEANKKYMNGMVIYLSTDLEILKTRVEKNTDDRPLLKKMSIEELYEKRKNLYLSFSDIVVDSSFHCMEELIEAVMKYEKSVSD